jgi:hypothetical protein
MQRFAFVSVGYIILAGDIESNDWVWKVSFWESFFHFSAMEGGRDK